MAFGLFILVNATLFIRPAEIIPDLEELPIYLTLILACLVLSFDRVRHTLSNVREQPITLCVLGLWVAAVLSHMAHFDTWSARQVADKFGRVVIYYLLLVSLVDTPARLRKFLACVLVSIMIMATLAILLYHEVLYLPGMKVLMQIGTDQETGQEVLIPRLCGSGVFNDPNDLCLALTMGSVLGVYWLTDKRVGPIRFLCFAPLGVFVYAIILTQSRGGLVGLLVASVALMWCRFGWKKTLPWAAAMVVAVFLLGGRQSELSLGEGTGQTRVQLWSEGFALFRGSPIVGIGTGMYSEEVGLVAHNSFVHAFAETGLIGGSLFVGAFYLAIWPLTTSDGIAGHRPSQTMARLRPFVLALVAGYAAGLWSLSRNYLEVTYMILGVGQSYLGLVGNRFTIRAWGPGLIRRISWAGVVVLVGTYAITRSTVSWG